MSKKKYEVTISSWAEQKELKKKAKAKRPTLAQVKKTHPTGASKEDLIFADRDLTIQHWDLWGTWCPDHKTQITKGLIIARTDEKCPIWKDKVGYKAVTVLIPKKLTKHYIDIDLLLSRNGYDIDGEHKLKNGDIAIRASYASRFY